MELLAGKNLLRHSDGSLVPSEVALADKKLVCFFYSAYWCPSCRQFTQNLKEFYQEVRSQGLEIVFVSSDRTVEDMTNYLAKAHGDWYSIEHGGETAKALREKYSVSKIPCLIVIRKEDGSLVTREGKADMQSKGPMAINGWL